MKLDQKQNKQAHSKQQAYSARGGDSRQSILKFPHCFREGKRYDTNFGLYS